jgi:enoyl-CoA hydratase/carnithine racemase
VDREYQTVRVEDRGEGLLLLTLNRPEVANASIGPGFQR